jgi:hypothetical protein
MSGECICYFIFRTNVCIIRWFHLLPFSEDTWTRGWDPPRQPKQEIKKIIHIKNMRKRYRHVLYCNITERKERTKHPYF